MTPEQFLNFWRLKAEDFKTAELSKLDGLMFDVVSDARQKGFSRAEVDEAAGGSLRDYLRESILQCHPDIEPSEDDTLDETDLGSGV